AAAEAWIELVKVVGHGEARYDEALRYAGFADASIARLGGDRELAARLDYYRCAILDLTSKLDDAEAACARSFAARQAVFGADARELGDVLVLEARLAIKRGKPADALARARRGVAIRERAFGPQHPSVIETLFTEGQAASSAADLDAADHAYTRALAIA